MKELVMSRPSSFFVALAASFLLLTGCVTKGSYDKVVEERDQLRQQNAALEDDTVDLSTELFLRDLDVAQLEREQQELTDEVTRWAVRGARCPAASRSCRTRRARGSRSPPRTRR